MAVPPYSARLIGHQLVQDALLKRHRAGQLPHALLFSGPRGIGKTTLAFHLAQFLLAGAPKPEPVIGLFGEEPVQDSLILPEDHPVRGRILAGGHGNLLLVQPQASDKKKTAERTLLVEQVRELVDFLHHTSAEAGARVVIIEPAEAMNINAANALLKILEEPPANSIILLISHQPGLLLPTILSRCQHHLLTSLPPNEAEEVFTLNGGDPALHTRLLPLAGGSPGYALSLQEHAALDYYDALTTAFAQPMEPAAITALAQRSSSTSTAEWAVQHAMLTQFLYRFGLFAAGAPLPGGLDSAEEAAFTRLAALHPPSARLALWDKAQALLAEVESRYLDKKMVLSSLFHGLNGSLQLG